VSWNIFTILKNKKINWKCLTLNLILCREKTTNFVFFHQFSRSSVWTHVPSWYKNEMRSHFYIEIGTNVSHNGRDSCCNTEVPPVRRQSPRKYIFLHFRISHRSTKSHYYKDRWLALEHHCLHNLRTTARSTLRSVALAHILDWQTSRAWPVMTERQFILQKHPPVKLKRLYSTSSNNENIFVNFLSVRAGSLHFPRPFTPLVPSF
jgi:hypothetical protein